MGVIFSVATGPSLSNAEPHDGLLPLVPDGSLQNESRRWKIGMWMSNEKRRVFARETSDIPFLQSSSKDEGEAASKSRNEILELIFDKFIRPDDSTQNASTTSRWQRARELWKAMLSEKRASYFIELRDSDYLEWIKTGEATTLPCTESQVETRNKNLPEFRGANDVVRQARIIRATFLKCIDDVAIKLIQRNVPLEKRQKLIRFRATLRSGLDAEWFLEHQPKVFSAYEKFLTDVVEKEPQMGGSNTASRSL